MRSHSRSIAALFVGTLGIPVFWAAGPDYAVHFGYGSQTFPSAEQDAPDGKKRVVLVYYVTNTAISQADKQNVRMTLRAYQGSTEICHVNVMAKVPQVMTFSLFYPAINPRTRALPPRTTRQYRLAAHIIDPDHMSGNEDPNYGNNNGEVTFPAPAGGTPSCALLE